MMNERSRMAITHRSSSVFTPMDPLDRRESRFCSHSSSLRNFFSTGG
ncbi:unnamed protein product [Amoebophrya sp. A25]|nr:unnamed protein product [Amoebophrya sp. A25]|eukprot:GSA25T00000827001.1